MRVSRKVFDELVEAAIAAIPEEVVRWLEEVPVIVEDRPTPSDLRGVEGDDEPLGLYDGGTLHEMESFRPPARVMLYRLPLMDACTTREQLAEEIRKTLLHELGHHTGLDEDDLEKKGFGPLEEDDEIDWDLDEGEDR